VPRVSWQLADLCRRRGSGSGASYGSHGRYNFQPGQYEPGEHLVAVVQDGFEHKPEQKAIITAGKRTALRFELTRAITTAFLRVDGGTPDADIFVDGAKVGRVGPDGTFAPIELAPDVDHTIRLQKEDYEPAEMKRKAVTKDTILISGSEARLKPFGILDLAIQPPDATVTIRRRGEAARRVSSPSLHLQEGTYTVSATADPARYGSFEQDVQVTSGQRTPFKVTVPRKLEPPPVQTKRLDIPDYFSAKDWVKDDEGFWFGSRYLRAALILN
jgi:hypothetical protein